MDRVLARLVPSGYLAIEGGPRTLARTFGVAVAIRLVLMPIACHADLISAYQRAHALSNGFRPSEWLPHGLVEAVFLALYSPILALDEMLVWEGSQAVTIDFWLGSFATHPQVFLALFLFKLPYLLCDLAIALVLLRLFVDTPTGGLRATSLWLLNPISIFVFYVLGRNDSISILLIALGLLGFHRSHPLRGALGFGLVIWSRFWPVFLLPFLVVVSSGDWRKRLPILAVALAPALLYASAVAFEAVDFVDVPVISLAWSRFADHLTSFRFEMGWAQDIFVLPAGYALLLMLASVAKPHGDLLIRFSGHAFACLSLIYATSLFSPAYFTWCLLFLVILRARSNSTLLRNLHYLQILLFVPYTFYWKRTLFGYLFAPLDPEFFGSLPAPTDWLAAHGSPLVLWNLVRTGFSVTCLCMAGWVLFGGGVRVAHCGESAESEEPLAPAR